MIDYTGVAGLSAVFFAGLTVLIPVAGFTARFALKPIVAAVGSLRDVKAQAQQVELVERRLALLEEQQHAADRLLDRLTEVQSFEAQLRTGSSARIGALTS
jgi:monomeric isocitrate dehydrogenase